MLPLEQFITLHKTRHHRKFITSIYGFVIGAAFVLSFSNNISVNASVAPTYLILDQNGYDEPTTQTIYPDSATDNIQSLIKLAQPAPREQLVEQEVEVKNGDTFNKILTGLGLDYSKANDVVTKLSKVYDVRSIRPGQKIFIKTIIDSEEGNKLLSLESVLIKPQVHERFIVEKDEAGEYIARAEKDELVEEINTATGVIEGNLSVSMNGAGVPNKVVADFINIFAFSIDFRRDVAKGDKFEVIYENSLTPDGEVIKTGNILYAALTLKKDKIALYRFKDKSGNVDYYNEKGMAMKRTLHRKPLAFQNARISSPFGRRRHPIYRDLRIHWGVDYAAPRGTAIYAAGDGVVQQASYNGGYGKYIKIRHNSEYSTAYGHMNGYAKGMAPGVRVKQGQIIGYVGNTGRSTGPHLHYEVIQNGKRVNPTTIKASAGDNLAGDNLKSFNQTVAGIKESHKNMFAEVSSDNKVAKK